MMNAEVHAFFDRAPEALALFEALWERTLARWPETTLKVQKTQITFMDPRGYLFASLPHRCNATFPRGCLVVSFGLRSRLESTRLAAVANPAPNRFTHHVAVSRESQLNDELFTWIEAARVTARERR